MSFSSPGMGQISFNNLFNFRRAGDVVKHGSIILSNTELNDHEKLKKLLDLDFLRVGVGGVQGNFKLIMFLCQVENIEQLIKYSLAVPEDPDNQDEAYK